MRSKYKKHRIEKYLPKPNEISINESCQYLRKIISWYTRNAPNIVNIQSMYCIKIIENKINELIR